MTNPGLATVDDRSFHSLVLECRRPTLVLFTAPDCLPCRMMARWLPALAREFDGALDVLCCSVEAGPLTARRYRIDTAPTLVLFNGGVPLATHSGLWPLPAISDWVRALLSDVRVRCEGGRCAIAAKGRRLVRPAALVSRLFTPRPRRA